MTSEMIALLDQAAEIDKTLRVRPQDLSSLTRKLIRPTPYSRSLMFSRMARGQISLFTNLQVPLNSSFTDNPRALLTERIRHGFPKSKTACIQRGRFGNRRRIKIPDLIRLWEGGRTILSVTDLHFRNTKLDDLIDTSALSDFNILCFDPDFSDQFKLEIEMMTMVISTKGNLTDNHADDCDGTNHCFLGKKLWLAWDRMEGEAAGFQDVDRNTVFSQAAFDMPTFLSLPSSRWFIVDKGKTLFLPGSLAHKVITLEHYMGVGSFHVALPSYLRCLKRWVLYDTHDIVPRGLLRRINRAVLRKLGEMQQAPKTVKAQWGVNHMRMAVDKWLKVDRTSTENSLLKNRFLTRFIEAALQV